MSLPGQVAVGASGAASYNIPISLPPGTAGMMPTLSLSYSSRGRNGLLGVGWTLSGLSSISRCPRTMAKDGAMGGVNYDANDRFCMDGQRLVAISGTYGADGTQYRTEIDTLAKVISHGSAGSGPAWFEVHTKAGQAMEFGHTADSQVLVAGKTTAQAWTLNKVSDSKANYFTVTYINDSGNGQVYPAAIDYTGSASVGLSPSNKVEFVYATRPDVAPYYQAGSPARMIYRLTNIKTSANGVAIADYRLAYQQSAGTQRSEISSITLCGSDGGCLPAATFSWTAGGNGTFGNGNPADTGIQVVLSRPPNGWDFGTPATATWKPITGDFNGDGKTDYVMFAGTTINTFLSNGDGTFTVLLSRPPNGWDFGTPASNWTPITGDFNGDGKTDFLMFAGTTIDTFLSNGDGTFTALLSRPPNNWDFGTPVTATWRPITGDFNGDGRTDFAMFAGTTIDTFLSNGDGTFTLLLSRPPIGWDFGTPASNWTPITGDFNGDGKTDFLMFAGTTIDTFLSNGDGSFTALLSRPPNGWDFGTPASNWTPITGDFNGDGKIDFVMFAGTTIDTFLSNGDGTFTALLSRPPNNWDFGTPATAAWLPIAGDFNGDGKTDFIMFAGTTIDTFLSNGDGTFRLLLSQPPAGWDFGTPPSNWTPITGDFNGDGNTDFLMFAGTTIDTFLANGGAADQISSVTTGLGGTISITYQSIAKGSVYTKHATSTYPVQDIQSPIYVVSRVDTSNGIGGNFSSTYTYAGAKLDLKGRGFLGFAQTSIKDLQTNITTTTTFRQDFPYIGLAASMSKSLTPVTPPGGAAAQAMALSQSSNTYQFSNASGGTTISPASAPYRVSLSQSVSSGSDLDGSVLPTVTTTSTYDAYNNPTQVVVSTPDGFSKTTANTYTNDPTLWYLCRLTRASVTSVAP